MHGAAVARRGFARTGASEAARFRWPIGRGIAAWRRQVYESQPRSDAPGTVLGYASTIARHTWHLRGVTPWSLS
jgi:hypothetical protein